MSDEILRGTAWVGGSDIHAYDIIQQQHWPSPLDPKENSKWVMAGVDSEFEPEGGFKSKGYSFVVAGSNFGGGGKSIEHPIIGLMGAGIKAIIADSVARLQFRNAINNGLPIVTYHHVHEHVETGDELEVNLATGEIHNLRTGETLQGTPVAEFVREVAGAGGIVAYIRQRIADGTIDELR